MFGRKDGNDSSPATSSFEQEPKAATERNPNYVDPDQTLERDDLNVVCPPHTTEARLMRKIDFRVIPFLCILYLLAFLDRVNIANAKAFHLVEDLHLQKVQYNTALTIFFVPYIFFEKDIAGYLKEDVRNEQDGEVQYNTALTIFFVPYIFFEIPSNVLLKKFSPAVWLSANMFLFGAVSVAQGFVTNYGGLLTTRFFLGVFEAGMFPGCFYLIGMWYKRSEAQKRYSFFFSSTTLAGAFAGLLASGIGKMQGIRNYNGWRWIFILEGILTCLVAIAFYFLLPSFPEDAKWLSPEEREYVKARLRVDQGNSAKERKITLRDIGRVFKDYKIFLGGFMYFGMIVPGYGYAFFAPSIVKTFGYSPIRTQLFSVPPWACAFAFSMIVATSSDFARHRFVFTIFPISVAISGFAILLGVHDNNKAQYAGMFLIAMGAYSAMPVIVCWFNMNLGGHHRRAVGTAWQVGFGNIGGIIATYAFLDTEAPRYTKGHAICLGFLCLSGISCTLYAAAVVYENRKRDKAPTDVALTEYEKTELGDLSPDYRYLL